MESVIEALKKLGWTAPAEEESVEEVPNETSSNVETVTKEDVIGWVREAMQSTEEPVEEESVEEEVSESTVEQSSEVEPLTRDNLADAIREVVNKHNAPSSGDESSSDSESKSGVVSRSGAGYSYL